MSPESVLISRRAWEAMERHVRQGLPLEVCGLLVGPPGLGQETLPVENAEASPTRFRMEPQGQVDALLDIERRGLALVAIYHSHPAGPPTPSVTDLEQAAYPEAAYLVWAPDEAGWSCRGFALGEAGFHPIPVELKGRGTTDRRRCLLL